MRECAELGIKNVWMHRSFGEGSVCDGATAYGREHGDHRHRRGLPADVRADRDVAHKVMRLVFTYRGHMPRTVP